MEKNINTESLKNLIKKELSESYTAGKVNAKLEMYKKLLLYVENINPTKEFVEK